MTPAITELERLGFSETVSNEERFVRKTRGEWSIIFVKASKNSVRLAESSPLVQALVDRGLSAASARRIVAQTNVQKVEEKIALVDWLAARKDARVQKNPAGFLYRAITDDFALPEDYQGALRAKAKAAIKVVPLRRQVAQSSAAATDRSAIDAFWNSIPLEEQERIEQDLVREAPLFLRQQYLEGHKERGLLFKTVRQAIIDEHVRKVLAQAPSRTSVA